MSDPRADLVSKGFPRVDYTELMQIAKHKDVNKDLKFLGNISRIANEYFIDSEESRHVAKDFLAYFWDNMDSRATTREFYSDRRDRKLPACLTFILGELKGKKVCVISHSPVSARVEEALLKIAKRINEGLENEFYELLTGSHENINDILSRLRRVPISEVKKPCAEKNLASALIKLFTQHGDDFQVLGITNTFLYPFLHEDRHSRTLDSRKAVLMPKVIPKCILDFDQGHGEWTLSQRCCKACANNKNAILNFCAAAQGLASGRYDRQPVLSEEGDRHSISPKSKTFRGATTLFISPRLNPLPSDVPIAKDLDPESAHNKDHIEREKPSSHHHEYDEKPSHKHNTRESREKKRDRHLDHEHTERGSDKHSRCESNNIDRERLSKSHRSRSREADDRHKSRSARSHKR